MQEDKKKQKPFTDGRWTEVPWAEVIGHRELTEEEQLKARKQLKEHMRHNGIAIEDD